MLLKYFRITAIGEDVVRTLEAEGRETHFHVGDGKRALIVYRADGYAVADCKTFHGKISENEAEANAVLFAAAPELLEALEDIRGLAKAAIDGNGNKDELLLQVKVRAGTAIAKATGNA